MKKFTLFFAALMACTLSYAQTDYSKTYTSNVTLAGENASAAKIVIGETSYDGMKAGTSSKAGSIKITIPANQTNLHIHAIAWKGEAGASVSITGATCTPSTLTLAANDGISKNSPFTISGDMLDDYYFNVALTGITKETELTLSCDKRFVVFGVNAVATAQVPATAIALNKTTATLDKGTTEQLTATLTPANATTAVVWATENAEIATVDKGLVTAVGVGTTNITATVTPAEGTTYTATCAVTVNDVTEKPIDGMNYSVDFTKAAEAKTWTIDNKEIGTLTTVWSIDSKYGYKGSAYVNGKNNAAESWLISPKLDLSKAEVATMTVNHALNQLKGNANTMMVKGTKDGETWVDLTVNGWPAGIDWTYMDGTVDLTSVISANTQIAFVYKSTTTVAPTWEIKKVTIEGSEAVHATGIALDKDTIKTEVYKYTQLTATLTPEEATDLVTWASDKETVATVSATGVVTAVSMGSAKITATAGSVSATCVVVVTEATPITCAQAVEIAKTVSANNEIAAGGKYVIHGYVTAVDTAGYATYNNYSVWMADTKDGGKVFEAFQVVPVDGKTIAAVGDYVEVVGDITKYTKDEETTYETVGKGAATIKVLQGEGTAVENIKAETGKAVKVIENGQLIIIRDNVRYNAVGAVIE